jgi:starvation-inducible DNA-binding protein
VTHDITAALGGLLVDVFSLYLKTKNFHWHMSGRHFRDCHLMLDEHGAELFAMTDAIAERARKIGGSTLRALSR